MECVKLLLASKARTDSQKSNSSVSNGGFMPLHFAAAKGHTEICQLLLDASANVQGGDRAVTNTLLIRTFDPSADLFPTACSPRTRRNGSGLTAARRAGRVPPARRGPLRRGRHRAPAAAPRGHACRAVAQRPNPAARRRATRPPVRRCRRRGGATCGRNRRRRRCSRGAETDAGRRRARGAPAAAAVSESLGHA